MGVAMLASRNKGGCFNARGPAKGDMYHIDETAPRTACEEAVWGKYGEPRMGPSDLLKNLEEDEIANDVALRKNHALAQSLLVPEKAVGTSPALAHAPQPMSPGSRVGEGVPSKGPGSFSTLHIRTAGGSVEECRHYIGLGMPLDAEDPAHEGWGVLHYAAKFDRTDVIELMLAHGADPLQEDWEGRRAHQIAAKLGNYAAQRILQNAISVGPSSGSKSLPAFQVGSDRIS